MYMGIQIVLTRVEAKWVRLLFKIVHDLLCHPIKTVIWSVAPYSAETWWLRKEDIKRIEVFEMWISRRTEIIRWT